jgi:hypothetical protein
LLTHPQVASRTCDDGMRWVFNTESGEVSRDKNTGRPIERPRGSRPPCFPCPKCANEADKSPTTGRRCDLSRKNRLTLARYYEQLVCPGPVDAIMRRNFGIIHALFLAHERSTQEAEALMKTALTRLLNANV